MSTACGLYLLDFEKAEDILLVNSGTTGRLKSLQLFLKEKNRHLAVRFNSDLPSVVETFTSQPGGGNIQKLTQVPKKILCNHQNRLNFPPITTLHINN